MLLERLLAVPPRERDAWVDALLGFEDIPADAADLPRGAVPYLPCGVDEILSMVRDAPVRPHDVFVDLGSGVGRVVLLVHLLTGARACGVELQAHLVALARERCAAFALSGVSFVHASAADVALDGSVFFLYAPFNGEMLASALRRIEEVARRRRIVVGTVGLELRDAAWLRPRASAHPSLAIYDSIDE